MGSAFTTNKDCHYSIFRKQSVNNGVERVIKIIVAGTRSTAVYLTEEAKTVFTSSGSFSGFNLEKTGNNAVAIGKEMNVRRTEK